MYKGSIFQCLFLGVLLAISATRGPASAAENEEPAAYKVSRTIPFDDRINAWVDGTVKSVDADADKFVVTGAKRPYATAYSKMLKEIQSKTEKLEGAEKQAKETEIRNAWRDKLTAAQKEPWDKNSDFTFYLPTKKAQLSTFDESRFYGRELQEADKSMADRSSRKEEATLSLTDLRPGDHLIVGYESGVLTNRAYTAIKARYADQPMAPINEAAPRREGPAADNTEMNKRDRNKDEVTADQQKQNMADIVITRNIRRALVNDDSLSTYAQNIKIITRDGSVTLKGPVLSEVEKSKIEKAATGVAGADHVINQIEVTR